MTDLDKLEELAKAATEPPSDPPPFSWPTNALAALSERMDPATVLSLVAECRELRRLKSAMVFLEAGYRPLRSLIPEQLLDQAKECGWKEGT